MATAGVWWLGCSTSRGPGFFPSPLNTRRILARTASYPTGAGGKDDRGVNFTHLLLVTTGRGGVVSDPSSYSGGTGFVSHKDSD
jgi:hypothetical protein